MAEKKTKDAATNAAPSEVSQGGGQQETLKFGRVPVPEEKLKALQVAMDKIDKSFGRGAIMKLGDEKIEDIAVNLDVEFDFWLGTRWAYRNLCTVFGIELQYV